jgi:hypothetical protein
VCVHCTDDDRERRHEQPAALIAHTPPGWTDAHRLGKRWPPAASFSEALPDPLLAPPGGEPECDQAVEIDLLKLNVRRIALRPPRIGQVLLRRVRDGGAGRQKEGEAA